MHGLVTLLIAASVCSGPLETFTERDTGQVVHGDHVATMAVGGASMLIVRDLDGTRRRLPAARWTRSRMRPPAPPAWDFTDSPAYRVIRVVDGRGRVCRGGIDPGRRAAGHERDDLGQARAGEVVGTEQGRR